MKKLLKPMSGILSALVIAAVLAACAGGADSAGQGENNIETAAPAADVSSEAEEADAVTVEANTETDETAPENDGTDTKTDETVPEAEEAEPVSDPEYKALPVLSLLDGDEYYLEADLDLTGTVRHVARKGDMLSSGYSGKTDSIFKDGKLYSYSEEDNIWVVWDNMTPDDSPWNFGGQAEVIEFYAFAGSGVAEFKSKSLFYEEFERGSETVRYFFDGDNLVGIAADGEELTFFVSREIPDGIFDLPEDAVFMTPAEYNVWQAGDYYDWTYDWAYDSGESDNGGNDRTGEPGYNYGEVHLIFTASAGISLFGDEYDIFKALAEEILGLYGAEFRGFGYLGDTCTLTVFVPDGAAFDAAEAAKAIAGHPDNPYKLTVR